MKSRFTQVTTAVLMVCASLFFMGCPEPVADVAVTGVTLNQSTLTVVRGLTGSLTPTVAPADATNKAVTWSTSDAGVATVANGVVTGVAVGTATITVTTADGAKTATCTVTVTLPAPAELFNYTIPATVVGNMDNGTKTGCYQPVKQLGVRVEQYIEGLYYYADSDGFQAGDAGGIMFNYYAAGTEVGYTAASVKSYISVGTDGKTITSTTTTDTYALDEDYDDVTTDYPSIELVINAKAYTGTTATLAILNSENLVLASQPLTETAADYTFVIPANQAIRIANGAAQGGSMYVYSIKGTETLTAYEAPVPNVESVTVSGAVSVNLGSTITLRAAVVASGGAAKTVTWSSSDETKATVSEAGVVTPVAAGTVTITATSTADASVTGTYEVEVVDAPPPAPVLGQSYEYNFENGLSGTFTTDDTFVTVTTTRTNNGGHGLNLTTGDTIAVKVAGSVTVSLVACVYSNASAAVTVTDSNGAAVVTALATKAAVDKDLISFNYEGAATTLTLTIANQNYVHGLKVEPYGEVVYTFIPAFVSGAEVTLVADTVLNDLDNTKTMKVGLSNLVTSRLRTNATSWKPKTGNYLAVTKSDGTNVSDVVGKTAFTGVGLVLNNLQGPFKIEVIAEKPGSSRALAFCNSSVNTDAKTSYAWADAYNQTSGSSSIAVTDIPVATYYGYADATETTPSFDLNGKASGSKVYTYTYSGTDLVSEVDIHASDNIDMFLIKVTLQ